MAWNNNTISLQKDDPVLYQEFVNDVKGEPFFERAEKPDDHKIWEKAEQWDAGYISDKVIFLTLTADIQKDRIEAGLMGWGRNRQSYMIDYWTFHGETRLIESKCWKELYSKIISEYKRSDDVSMRVQIAFIDSQYNKDQVNTFCDQFDYHPNTLAGV